MTSRKLLRRWPNEYYFKETIPGKAPNTKESRGAGATAAPRPTRRELSIDLEQQSSGEICAKCPLTLHRYIIIFFEAPALTTILVRVIISSKGF